MSSSTSNSEAVSPAASGQAPSLPPATWNRVALVLTFWFFLPFLALELWVRCDLFSHTLYSNSRALDASWKALNSRNDWSIVYLGDSEVRWGLDPDVVDAELAAVGYRTLGFNMGIDGFSSVVFQALLPHLDLPDRMPQLRVAVIGTQLIQQHRDDPVRDYGDIACTALQRPIFTSAMARDLGFEKYCREPHWTDRVSNRLEDVSAVVRYRRQVKYVLVGWADATAPLRLDFARTALNHRPNGFQPNRSMREAGRDPEQLLQAKRRQEEGVRGFSGPLDEKAWARLTAPGHYFDRWADYFIARGILPVFAALPTNPMLVDLMGRRPDHARNGAIMRRWAARRGDTVFVDLGIKDDYEIEVDYSDIRHLSIHGSRKFSAEFGRVLARHPLVAESLEDAPGASASGSGERAPKGTPVTGAVD
jgi:hypothetical protein